MFDLRSTTKAHAHETSYRGSRSARDTGPGDAPASRLEGGSHWPIGRRRMSWKRVAQTINDPR